MLICGPTGGGKSTLLDGISVALYGVTSGDERAAKEMRCTYASPSTPTEVVFDFALGEKRYRVRRTPEHERQKQRGVGITKIAASASLWERTATPDENDEADGDLLAAGIREVAAQVEKLLGFRVDQFRQVVMLPQGKFRELLSANAQAKEDLLTVLFGTDVYQQITDALLTRRSQLLRSRELAEVQRNASLAQAGVSDSAALDALTAALDAELAAVEKQLPEVRASHAAATSAMEHAKRSGELLKELAAARAEELALNARSAGIAIDRDLRSKLRSLAPLVEIAKVEAARTSEAAATTTALGTARVALTAAEAVEASAGAGLQLERGNDAKREILRADLAKLTALRATVDRIEEAAKDSTAKTAATVRLKNAVPVAEGARAQAQVRLEAARAALIAVRRSATTADECELRLHQVRSRLLLARRAEAATKRVADAGAVLSRATKAMAAAEQKRLLVRATCTELEAKWRKGQSLVLARALVAGEPCSVCGSCAHPLPADDTTSTPPSDAELDAARDRMIAVDAAHAAAQAALASANASHAEAERTSLSAQEEAGSLSGATTDSLVADEASATGDLATATAAKARIAALVNDERAAEESCVLAQDAVAKATALQTSAAHAASLALATLRTLEHDVPEALRRRKDLEAAAAQVMRSIGEMDAALLAAQANNDAAARSRLENSSRVESLTQYEQEQLAQAAAAAEAFAAALSDLGLSREAFAALRTRLSELSTLDAGIERYDAAVAASSVRVARAAEGARDVVPADTAAADAHLRESAARLTACIEENARLNERSSNLKRLVDKHAEVSRALDATEREVAAVSRIADLARGMGGAPMSFARWVLSAFLDDVLATASERLWLMSRGRYRLERGADAQHRGRGAGLDLVVWDAWTGTTRPVSTLSGGEGFLAALALALGLADVVQAHCGGIHLDALFIDEGFGTLDPEALELALRALSEMTAEGRLVGIISHVPELRERIAAHIEVTTGQHGSRVALAPAAVA